MARKPRGVAKPSEMTTEEAVRMCRDHVTVPLWPHTGQALGWSRDKTYSAARAGEIGGLIEVGGSYRVATAWLRRVLGLDEQVAA